MNIPYDGSIVNMGVKDEDGKSRKKRTKDKRKARFYHPTGAFFGATVRR